MMMSLPDQTTFIGVTFHIDQKATWFYEYHSI